MARYVVALSACDFLQGYFYFVVGLRAFRYNDELFCEAHAYVALWSATASFLWTACLTAYVAAFFWRGLPAKLNRAPARRTTAGFALVCFGYPSAACAVVAATGAPMDAGGGGDSADSYGCFIDASWCLARLGALYAPLWACMLVASRRSSCGASSRRSSCSRRQYAARNSAAQFGAILSASIRLARQVLHPSEMMMRRLQRKILLIPICFVPLRTPETCTASSSICTPALPAGRCARPMRRSRRRRWAWCCRGCRP